MVVARPDLSLQLEKVALPGIGPGGWRGPPNASYPCDMRNGLRAIVSAGYAHNHLYTFPGVVMTVRGSMRGPTHKICAAGASRQNWIVALVLLQKQHTSLFVP